MAALGELWPQSGLVGSYHLSSTTDSSGNSNTLTNNNTVGFVAGKFSNCADFGTANTNKYLSRTDGLGANLGSGAYSISLWVKVRTAPTGTYQLIDWKSTTTTPSYFQLFYQFSVSLRLYTQFGDTGKVQNTDLGTTLWQHISCTCSAAGACAIYLNGSLLFTDTRTNFNAGNTLGVGASSAGGSPSSVYLDEVNFFNKELTANEIRRYYANAIGKFY